MAKKEAKVTTTRRTTLSGMPIHMARKFGKFVFRDFYITAKLNDHRRCFEILVYNKVESSKGYVPIDRTKIDDLEEFFKSSIKVIVVPIENREVFS